MAAKTKTTKRSLRERLSANPNPATRVKVVVLLFIVSLVLLTVRLVDLQVVRAQSLAETAIQFRARTYTLPAERGKILDSEGNVLAVSTERYNVAVNQNLIENYIHRNEDGEVVGRGVVGAAAVLSPILGIEEAKLAGILLGGEQKSTWRYIARDLSPETWRQINSYGIPGIEPESYMKREYPNGRMAAAVLGFIGEDGEGHVGGQAGIEKSRDEVLSGEDGSLTVEISGSGAVIPSGRKIETPSTDGADVNLTIDSDLQFALDEALTKSVTGNSAEWGVAVAVEVGTGRVLALSETNTFDPSKPGEGGSIGSRAVQAPVEPGSTGKLITFSSVFDQETVTPLSMYQVSSTITMPNGETIKDNEPHPTEMMTLAGIIATSYNTGLIQIGDTISDETRFDYMRRFGLGERTGIELPAESAGILSGPEQWGPREHYTTMFGQGYALTAVQLAQVIATIGNDGVRTDLHLIDSITHPDGSVEPTVVDEPVRVISEEASANMIKVMQAVTDPYATGYYARVPGYNIAGKTGTAQVPDANGALTGRVGTFAGVIPAEDPQIAVAVVVYNGAGPGYGGTVAAPVFADFGKFAVRHLGIPPSTTEPVKFPWRKAELDEAKKENRLNPDGSYASNPES